MAEGHDDADAALARVAEKVAVGAQRRFGHAVALEDETAELFGELLAQLLAERGGAAEDEADWRQVVLLLHRILDEQDGDGRHQRHDADAELLDGRQQRFQREALDEHERQAADHRVHRRADAERVEQGQHHHGPVRRVRLDVFRQLADVQGNKNSTFPRHQLASQNQLGPNLKI